MEESYFLTGPGKYKALQSFTEGKNYSSVFIIADKNTEKFCLPTFSKQYNFDSIIVIPSGEENKSISTLNSILEQLQKSKANRNSLLISLGGGMVSDVAGLAASLYMRGIDYINVPTTLLAMTDAAIGGKTAVNSGSIKNIVGSFHQPVKILIDKTYLSTLPERQLLAGYAEMLKHFILKGDLKFLSNETSLINEEAIIESAKYKKSITDSDNKDLD